MTDTEKWNGSWFGNLDTKEKLIWLYICDRCDMAGVFEINEKLMSFHLGFKVDKKGINTLLIGKAYPISETKIFIPAFIEFQYGQLTEECRPHKPVIKVLNDLNLFPVLENYKNGKGKLTLPIPYQKGINTLQDKDKEKDKDKDKDNNTYANDNIGPFEKELAFIENPTFKEIMRSWLKYKKDEHKETYKSQTTLEACYKNLLELSKGDSAAAQQIINQSIANKWKGLFEIKTGGFKAKQSANALPSPADKYDVK